MTIGAPSRCDLILETRLRVNVHQFIAVAMLARTEAIKRGRPIVFCRSVVASRIKKHAASTAALPNAAFSTGVAALY